MSNEIRREAARRGITRLCHFTPSRNLAHIASDRVGILATKRLQEHERRIFTPTDLSRLDGHEAYISCSIEYPNVWYFDKAKSRDIVFKDWVVLFITPKYLWHSGTRFCPRNAASNCGRDVSEGEAAFLALFDDSIKGAYGKAFTRLPVHLSCCPTDDQAEVLIPDQIALADILTIAVATKTQAKNEVARFRLMNIPEDRFKFVIAPDLFDKNALSRLIRSGKRPVEIPWLPRDKA